MEFSIRDYIREVKNAMNTRLDILESMIVNGKPSSSESHQDFSQFELILASMNAKIESIEAKLNQKEKDDDEDALPSLIVNEYPPPIKNMSVNYCKKCAEPIQNCICDISSTKGEFCDECGRDCDGAHGASGEKALQQMRSRGLDVVDDKIVVVKKEEEQNKDIINQIRKDLDAHDKLHLESVKEEEEVVEEEVVEEEEEEALVEFEYKGVTLYRDSENKVYQKDDEGELIDTPIGRWSEEKKKILKLL